MKDLHVAIIDRHSGIFDKFEFDAIVGMSYKYSDSVGGPILPTFMEKIAE